MYCSNVKITKYRDNVHVTRIYNKAVIFLALIWISLIQRFLLSMGSLIRPCMVISSVNLDSEFTDLFRWVHTCNVTAYRNAVPLQVTATIWSYDLNFHPVPHGVTESCESYTMGFSVCYESHKHHERIEGERSGRWLVSRCTSKPAQAVTVSSL
jgi:hypothetical protein